MAVRGQGIRKPLPGISFPRGTSAISTCFNRNRNCAQFQEGLQKRHARADRAGAIGAAGVARRVGSARAWVETHERGPGRDGGRDAGRSGSGRAGKPKETGMRRRVSSNEEMECSRAFIRRMSKANGNWKVMKEA